MNSRSFCVGDVHPMAARHHPSAFTRTVVGQVDEGFAEHTVIVPVRLKTAEIWSGAPMPTFVLDMGRLTGVSISRLIRVVNQVLMFLKAHVTADHILNNREQNRVHRCFQ